jgi:hypothetical protein
MAMTIENEEFRFGFFFLLTLLSSWVGDDDVAYNCLDRKPTGKEGIARIRYVLVKFYASMSGGALLTIAFVKEVLERILFIKVSLIEAFCISPAFIAIVALLIGVLQNGIRLYQGRQTRPVFDVSLLRHNREQWRKWFRSR